MPAEHEHHPDANPEPGSDTGPDSGPGPGPGPESADLPGPSSLPSSHPQPGALPPFLDERSIADAIERGFVNAEARLIHEHAPLGLDALSEVGLHPIIADALRAEGWGVVREAHYPGDYESGDSARDRCDLVITDDPAARLLDPVHADRRLQAASETLFASLAPEIEAQATAGETRPEDAFWLEVKSVGQYAYRDGVPGPNRGYAAEMIDGPAADICKLIGDGVIVQAAFALILFTADADVAVHDATATAHALLDMGLPIGVPEVRSASIADRVGNAFVTVAVFPCRGLGMGSGFSEIDAAYPQDDLGDDPGDDAN